MVVVSLAMLMATTGCLGGVRAGQRCRTTDHGTDGAWVLQCRGGRWVRLVTLQQLAAFAAAAMPPAPVHGGPPIRVIVGGDSTGTVMARAFARYAARHPGAIEVVDVSMVSCPVTFAHSIRHYEGEPGQGTSHCSLWAMNVPAKVEQFRPEASFVFLSMMEQADQRAAPTEPWRNVFDPAWAAHQRTFFSSYADQLNATGGRVFWADVPIMRFGQRSLPWLSDHPARTATLNASYRQFADEHPAVELLPFAHRIDRPFGAIDRNVRPDGIHLTDAAADAEVANWLVPILVSWFRSAPAG